MIYEHEKDNGSNALACAKVSATCFNCIHSVGKRYAGHSGTFYEPPEPAECHCDYEENVDIIYDQFEADHPKNDIDFEEYVASKCEHYTSEKVKCPECKKEIESTDGYYAENLCDYHIVCSAACLKKSNDQLEADLKAEEKAAQEYDAYLKGLGDTNNG